MGFYERPISSSKLDPYAEELSTDNSGLRDPLNLDARRRAGFSDEEIDALKGVETAS